MRGKLLTLMFIGTCGSAMAQESTMMQNGWFNHVDAAVNVSTSGVGFDIASPMGSWASLRVGGHWRPFVKYDATFNFDVAEGLSSSESNSRFEQMADIMKALTGKTPTRSVAVEGDMRMNNFKLLVDFFPIKDNHRFRVTAGFYYGNKSLIDARNSAASALDLQAVNIYNTLYKRALAQESIIDLEALGIANSGGSTFEEANEKLRNWGARLESDQAKSYNDGDVPSEINELLGIDPTDNRYFAEWGLSVWMGTMKRDIVATEDIYYDYSEKLDNPYWIEVDGELQLREYRTDANGREIKEGNLRYAKGEVIYHAGDALRYVPDEDGVAEVKSHVNRFKPYIGVGYSWYLTKDHRTQLGVDAGVMLWGGTPSINVKVPVGNNADGETVYAKVNLAKDVKDSPSKIQHYIDILNKFPVFPEIGIRISHRIW